MGDMMLQGRGSSRLPVANYTYRRSSRELSLMYFEWADIWSVPIAGAWMRDRSKKHDDSTFERGTQQKEFKHALSLLPVLPTLADFLSNMSREICPPPPSRSHISISKYLSK